jgi:predicted Zn-dependent protease
MLTLAQARAITEQVLAAGKQEAKGGDVAVRLVSSRSANTRFAVNEITSTGDVDDTEIEVTVGFGLREATATANQTDRASLRELVARTARLARIAPENKERQPLLPPQRYRAVAGAHDPATASLGAGARAAAAKAAIDAARSRDLQIAGFHEHEAVLTALATSAGLFGSHLATRAQLSMTARTRDGTGSGWSGVEDTRAAGIDARALAATAVDKAVRSAKPRRLEPGRYTVVLEPAAVSGLLGGLDGALDRRSADESRSVFARPGGGTRIGEALFERSVTVRSDPYSAVMPAAPFDGEGVPHAATSWIEGGVLRQLATLRFWAKKSGVAALPSPPALELAPGTATREQLIKGVKRGVLVTRFWYIRMVDARTLLLTGLTRDGVFLIENGEVTAPVNNFRFNESPIAMLRNVVAIGNDSARVPSDGGVAVRTPSLCAREFNLASISDAV